MKRQGGDILGNESERIGKKAAAEKRCEEEEVGDGGDGGLTEEEIWEEWLWRWGEGVVQVDEEMWWGTCWDPCWDVGIMGREAYNELYNDVLWEDDVWDLKQIKDVPIVADEA